jgi:hypothetical protein
VISGEKNIGKRRINQPNIVDICRENTTTLKSQHMYKDTYFEAATLSSHMFSERSEEFNSMENPNSASTK